MPIDPTTEKLITLNDAAKLPWLPKRRRGKKLHISTLFRWAIDGMRGAKLETLRFGGTLCTSEAARKRFFGALSDPTSSTHQPTDKSRLAYAERELQAEGI